MLEITKIQYTEKPSDVRPDATEITGSLSIHYAFIVDNRVIGFRDRVKDQIAAFIWREAYGDITQPLTELETIVRHSVRPEYYDRIRELFNQLNALLTRKYPPNRQKEGER